MATPQLVTVGYQVVVQTDGKRENVGRRYHVRSAAEQLRDLLRLAGKDAHCVDVQMFERGKKVIK